MKSMLIRAEDKNRYERRAPLVPGDVKKIIEETGAQVHVEPSEKRFFSLEEYASAGALSCESMADGEVIFGVKEIPEEKILDNKVYVFFSHTIKGQKSGMPLLKKIISGGSTLIDYEKIANEKNQRLIYFGRYAGDAGAIDILWLMGRYWAHHGIITPFAQMKNAFACGSVAAAETRLKTVADTIKEKGFPSELSPLVIGILGYGNVSGGAQHIFDCLPTKRIEPGDLEHFVKERRGNPNTVYLTVFKEKDLVEHKNGSPFDLSEYYHHPEKYASRFDRFLPYLNILVNAVYWESRYPRFVTWESLKKLYADGGKPRLCGIADITCDTNGSIECNVKSTDTGMPAYLCDPLTRKVTDGHEGEGIVVLAVDNLPCELPADASCFFSKQLAPFVPGILRADYSGELKDSGLSPEIQKAVIVYNGKLTPDYRYLETYLTE